MTDIATEDLARIVREHPFFAGLDERFYDSICGCATHMQFEAGTYLFREGEAANHFYLLRHGRVVLEIKAPQGGAMAIQTLRAGEILGVSWVAPPYRWAFDAKAIELTRAIAVDAACLRQKCDEDHDFGYEMMRRFVPVLMQRLQTTRLQLLDVYGKTT
jgi:CRP/FNR family cyclic AMP-dependent transcriptional regulator